MPTPAQMCCAAGICCDPPAARVAQEEIRREFETDPAMVESLKRTTPHRIFAALGKVMKPNRGDG